MHEKTPVRTIHEPWVEDVSIHMAIVVRTISDD
jgi:hypothetical protein